MSAKASQTQSRGLRLQQQCFTKAAACSIFVSNGKAHGSRLGDSTALVHPA